MQPKEPQQQGFKDAPPPEVAAAFPRPHWTEYVDTGLALAALFVAVATIAAVPSLMLAGMPRAALAAFLVAMGSILGLAALSRVRWSRA